MTLLIIEVQIIQNCAKISIKKSTKGDIVWYWFTFIFGQRMLFQMTPTLVYYNNKNFLKMVKGDKLQNDNTSIVSLRINILYCRFRKHLL